MFSCSCPEDVHVPGLSQLLPVQVYTVNDVPRNLALIKLLRAKADGDNLQRRRASGVAGGGPPADAEAGRTGSTRKKTPFTESGPHQPCVMPACGHTFKRIAVENLLNRARRSQLQAQQQQADQIDERRKASGQLLPFAVALWIVCLLCLSYDIAMSDGVTAGIVRAVLLSGILYVRWQMRVCGIIGIENFDENAPIARDPVATYAIECSSCGTKQPEVCSESHAPFFLLTSSVSNFFFITFLFVWSMLFDF